MKTTIRDREMPKEESLECTADKILPCCEDDKVNTNGNCENSNDFAEREEAREFVSVADDTSTCSCRQWLLLLLFPFLIAAVTVIMTMAYYYVRIRFLDFADSTAKEDDSIYSIYNETQYNDDDDHYQWNEFISQITEYHNNVTMNAHHVYHHHHHHHHHQQHYNINNFTNYSKYYNSDISDYHTYHEVYWVLRPGMTLINQSLPNPALTKNIIHNEPKEFHSTSSLESNEEFLHAEHESRHTEGEHELTTAALQHVEHKRRYVLDGMERGKRYMLRLCYLGSPSVWYQVNFLHVRQSFITQTIDIAKTIRRHELYNISSSQVARLEEHRHKEVETTVDDTQNKNNDKDDDDDDDGAFHLLDTEVRMFSMHALYPRQFAWDGIVIETESWPESIRVGNVSSSSFSKHTTSSSSSPSPESSAHHRDSFVAVIEIIPHVLAETVSPEQFPFITYNIHLNALTANFLPDVAFPYILTVSLLVFLPLYVALQNANLQLADVRHGFFIFTCIRRLLHCLLTVVWTCFNVLPTLCAKILLCANKQKKQEWQQNNSNRQEMLQTNRNTSDDSSMSSSDTKCDHNSQETSRVVSLTRKVNLDDSVKVTSEYILPDDIQISHPFSASMSSSSEAPSSTSFQVSALNGNTLESSRPTEEELFEYESKYSY